MQKKPSTVFTLIALPFLSLVVHPATLAAQSGAPAAVPEDMREKIDAAANQILQATQVPSASIAVVKAGHIAYLQAYGLARLAAPLEATPQMQYSVGSISMAPCTTSGKYIVIG